MQATTITLHLKKVFFVLAALVLTACGAKIEGTYVLDNPKADGKVHIVLAPGGKGSTNMLIHEFEQGLQYEVNGDKVTIRFQGGSQGGAAWTIEDGAITSPIFGKWKRQ